MKNFRAKLYTNSLFSMACVLFVGCDAPQQHPKQSFDLKLCEIVQSSESTRLLHQETSKKNWVPGRFGCDGQDQKVEIRFAGKSSLYKLRKSFKIKAEEEDIAYGSKDILLSAQAADITHLRSLVGAQIFEWLKLPTFKQKPVFLYHNSKPLGLYTMIEPVDMHFFQERNLKPLQVFKAQYRSLKASTLKLESLSKLEAGFERKKGVPSYSKLEKLIKTISETKTDEDIENLESILNVDSAIRYFAVAAFVGHHDGYSNNYYLYLAQDGKFGFVPWDLDMVFDTPPRGPNYLKDKSLFQVGENALPKLFQKVPALKSRYLQTLKELTEKFSVEEVHELVDQLADSIEAAYLADRTRISRSDKLKIEIEVLKETMKNWIDALNEDLNGYFQ